MNINAKSVYLLGFLCADGDVSNRSYNKFVRIEILEKDFRQIKTLFPFLVKQWYFYKRQRPNRQLQAIAMTTDKTLHRFFIKNNSIKKFLNKIPKKYHKNWFHGLIDGDGCFYYNPKNYTRHFSICSNYNENWHEIEKILRNIKIKKYKITKRIQGKNKHSVIRISNKKDIRKIGKYIYGNKFKFGLKRKFIKWKTIIA